MCDGQWPGKIPKSYNHACGHIHMDTDGHRSTEGHGWICIGANQYIRAHERKRETNESQAVHTHVLKGQSKTVSVTCWRTSVTETNGEDSGKQCSRRG